MKRILSTIAVVLAGSTASAADLTYNLTASETDLAFGANLTAGYAQMDLKYAEGEFKSLSLIADHEFVIDKDTKLSVAVDFDGVSGKGNYMVAGSKSLAGLTTAFELGGGDKRAASVEVAYKSDAGEGMDYSVGVAVDFVAETYELKFEGKLTF